MTFDAIILDLWRWLTEGIQLHRGLCVCAVVAISFAWYLTRSNGTVEYPQEPQR